MISVKSTVFEFGKWMNFGFVFQFYRWADDSATPSRFICQSNRAETFVPYLAHSTIPEEKEDLLIHENVTRFLNECFLRTMKHEKSVMRTNIQDCRTISGTFLYPNPDCYFRNQFCVRLCNNPQMKFESKEDSLRMDSWIKSKCGLLRFWFVRFFEHGRILEVYLRSGFNVRK